MDSEKTPIIQNDSIKTEEKETLKNKETSWSGVIKEILMFGLIAFGIVLPFRYYVAEPYLVDGRSMYPTFDTGDYLIVDKISPKKFERNSVVVFKYPNNENKNFIKRVIGLPGETVIINDGVVGIINDENPDGFILEEDYVIYNSPSFIQIALDSDEYFVMGDNRGESFDSRSWGPLKEDLLIGKPLFRLLPVSKLEVFPGKLEE